MTRKNVKKCVAVVAIALAAALAPWAGADESMAPVELRLERQFTPRTNAVLAEGGLTRSPRATVEAVPPVAAAVPTRGPTYTMLPALVFGALFVALTAFAAGVLATRRRQVAARHAAAPVQLWADSETLAEAEQLQLALADQRHANEALVAEQERLQDELAQLKSERQRDNSAQEIQALILDDGDELEAAQRTIDELRAEVEKLRGADSDLERERRFDPGDGGVEALHVELERRQAHIAELEQVMIAARDDREALESREREFAAQLEALEQALAERTEELELAAAELQGLRGHSATGERVAELEAELAEARELAAAASEQRERSVGLEHELALMRQHSEARKQRIAELEVEAQTQQQELARLTDVEAEAERHERRIEALERELTSRLEEIKSLRAEAVALMPAPAAGNFEQEFADSQAYVLELEDRNDRLQGRLHELEQALRRDEDVTTQLELSSGGAEAARPGDVQALKLALDRAEQRALDLEQELDAAREELALANQGDSAADLQRKNIKLSAMVVQRDNDIAELQSRLAAVQKEDSPAEHLASTISSLENESQRKTQLRDKPADDLRVDEQKVAALEEQLDELRERLAASEEERDTREDLLARNKNMAMAAALRGRLHDNDDETIRLRLEPEMLPEVAEPASGPKPVDPAAADIETLQFTLESRRDLARSLESISAEESKALAAAKERVSAREDQLVALENEIAANRVTIAAMQNRLAQAREQGAAVSVPGKETQRLEHELQRSVRAIEKLHLDLRTWRRRVRPLHEALVLRDQRIRSLEGELKARRQVPLALSHDPAPADDDGGARAECLEELATLDARIRELEVTLADTGLSLSRALARDETLLQELEELESARTAQLMRIDELHHELETAGASAAKGSEDNIVDFPARNP